MKILSMTATFGKLEHETLTLKPGLNIIEAPNEWGKSTWCAFLVAMLYGIETRVHTTKASLADKERYTPWSGSPMSGRIDLIWKDHQITIERKTKGRSIFGDFRAYETETGLAIPELTAANCGQMLLGVEKSVFVRAGFLKLTDLPVTQDESLRRRLNALVTTGDESGSGDILAQKLKDLKNRCRFNKTGLLPQAEAQRSELEAKLSQLRLLQDQSQRLRQRQAQLEEYSAKLENHRDALHYDASRTYAQKLTAAKAQRDAAEEKVQSLQALCSSHPSIREAEHKLLQLRQLRSIWDSMHMESQMLPSPPVPPEIPGCFRDLTPQEAGIQAAKDYKRYQELCAAPKKSPAFLLIPAILLLLAGTGLLAAKLPIPGAISLAAGLAFAAFFLISKIAAASRNKALQYSQEQLLVKYRPLPPEQWQPAAQSYADNLKAYSQALRSHRNDRGDLDSRIEQLKQQLLHLTEGQSLQQCQEKWTRILENWKALEDARRELQRSNELLKALVSSHKEVPAPKYPDDLTFTEAETATLLSDTAAEQRQLQLRLGQCLGQMDGLGQEAQLTEQLAVLQARIRKLEDIYAALALAQETLAAASTELQRRFAPRISQRAREIFSKLTDARYDRLTLGEDLSIQAGAQGEDTLYASLWRSDGTIDQLYLALRLAVAEELTPQAPLILDDALVRFDDRRLSTALEILQEEAQNRQVLLFTCQDRERRLIGGKRQQ